MKSIKLKAGFTLIEVMLAMGILTIGMTAVLGRFTFGAALSQAAELRTDAAYAVEVIGLELPAKLFPLDEEDRPGPPVELRDQEVEGLPAIRYHALAEPVADGPTAEDGGPLEYEVRLELFFTSRGVRRVQQFRMRMLRERSFADRIETARSTNSR